MTGPSEDDLRKWRMDARLSQILGDKIPRMNAESDFAAIILALLDHADAALADRAALAARLAEVERRLAIFHTSGAVGLLERAEQAEAERDDARAAVERVATEQRQLLQALPHDWREQHKRAQKAEAALAAVSSLHADTGNGWCSECHTSPCKTRAALRGEAGEGRA